MEIRAMEGLTFVLNTNTPLHSFFTVIYSEKTSISTMLSWGFDLCPICEPIHITSSTAHSCLKPIHVLPHNSPHVFLPLPLPLIQRPPIFFRLTPNHALPKSSQLPLNSQITIILHWAFYPSMTLAYSSHHYLLCFLRFSTTYCPGFEKSRFSEHTLWISFLSHDASQAVKIARR